MKVLVIGAGAVSSKINLFLQEWGHEVQAQLPTLSAGLLSAFDAGSWWWWSRRPPPAWRRSGRP